MHYRCFEKTAFKVSGLGFGCMRLPTQGGKINFPEATRIVRHAIESPERRRSGRHGRAEICRGKGFGRDRDGAPAGRHTLRPASRRSGSLRCVRARVDAGGTFPALTVEQAGSQSGA